MNQHIVFWALELEDFNLRIARLRRKSAQTITWRLVVARSLGSASKQVGHPLLPEQALLDCMSIVEQGSSPVRPSWIPCMVRGEQTEDVCDECSLTTLDQHERLTWKSRFFFGLTSVLRNTDGAKVVFDCTESFGADETVLRQTVQKCMVPNLRLWSFLWYPKCVSSSFVNILEELRLTYPFPSSSVVTFQCLRTGDCQTRFHQVVNKCCNLVPLDPSH